MSPSLCRRCVSLGAKVVVQQSAGITAGFTDAEYRSAGATLVADAAKIWAAADLILKVKEPLPAEYPLLREGQTLFTYLHLAAGPELAKELLKKKILGISNETVEGADGQFPLLKPMSQIAGWLSIQIGAYILQSQHGGSGVLLGGIPGTMPGTWWSSARATPAPTPCKWPWVWARASPCSISIRESLRRSTPSIAVASSCSCQTRRTSSPRWPMRIY